MGGIDLKNWIDIIGFLTAVVVLGNTFVTTFNGTPIAEPTPNDILTPISAPIETTDSTDSITVAPTGSIKAASTPKGASIYLDNKYQGITPINLNNIEQGSHTILIKLEGYEDYSETESVNANKTVSILADLKKINPEPTPVETQASTPTTGSISVTSTPVGASVYLDGTYEGETPKILKDVEQGSHKVTLKLEKYKSWSETISVDAGETFPLSPTLISNASQESNTPQVIPKPSGKINNVWFENGVWNGNLQGVNIGMAYNTENLKDKKCSIGIKFYNNHDNTPLRDTNRYYGTAGNVVIRHYFMPSRVSYQNDWALFIPYDEFHMDAGPADIRFKVSIIDDGDNILDESIWKYFSFIKY